MPKMVKPEMRRSLQPSVGLFGELCVSSACRYLAQFVLLLVLVRRAHMADGDVQVETEERRNSLRPHCKRRGHVIVVVRSSPR